MLDLRTEREVQPRYFLDGYTGQCDVQSRALACVRGLTFHITLVVPPCPNIQSIFGRWYDSKSILILYIVSVVGLGERPTSPRGRASLRPGSAHHSRDHFGTDAGRTRLAPLYVPVNASPVSRESNRNSWCSIGPSTIVAFKLQTSRCVRKHIIADTMFMFSAKRPLYLRL